MITDKVSSAITVFCDCPYTGKTREIISSPDDEERRRNRLRRKLKESNQALVLAKNVLMDTHNKLAVYKRLLCSEMGWDVDPYVTTGTTWQDRVKEESYLKSELMHLVDYLRECDPQFRNDPACYPTKLSASAEDLLLAKQEKYLRQLYHGYSVYKSENERSASEWVREYLKLKENYENKLYCNKLMEKEIEDVKKKISSLQKRFIEDKILIDYITNHKFEMKGTFLKEEAAKDECNDGKQATGKANDPEVQKFKKMWQDSLAEKERLMNSIQELKKNIEFANRRIVRSEQICARNVTKSVILFKKIKDGILLTKIVPGGKDEFGKFSRISYRLQRSQVDAAVAENRYLRNFLRKAILSKAYDMKYLQNSLLSTAEKYRVILEDVRKKPEKK